MKSSPITDIFGENVFSLKIMREYLSAKAYQSLAATICEGRPFEVGIADEVADAMKTWAIAQGATHYSHWFQPLTGTTAEKHDSFIAPDRQGGALTQFSSKELIKGEPDASSFPSGGIRSTFEARGYTAWDPTSPAFIKKTELGGTMCIPSVFCSYHGEALDKKTPLLRSMSALSTQVIRLARLFGIKTLKQPAFAELGVEQEYFLVDRALYERRLDLLQTGRTIFGGRPAKHQQMSDHYFGAIKSRVIAFMDSLDREMWKLGIPARTRHNEVAPGQFEIAALYEEMNLAVDHNMMTMEVLKEVAEQHGFACLLHEKPFAGVNGSGKHNNWSVTGPDGKNWLAPGDNPRDNARFLTMICAFMKAIDQHAALLRASISSAGNDLRLGAHEAPPAIMSIFLGEQLAAIVEHFAQGTDKKFGDGGVIKIGVSSLPSLPKDLTDRNRTSPFAFTGNKFEFRAVGSSQSCAGANTIINTILAESLDEISSGIDSQMQDGKTFNDALRDVLRQIVTAHRRIIFNGDNYTDEWRAEAHARGLPNVGTTPEALEAMIAPKSIAMFEKYNVLTARELHARYDVYMSEYEAIVNIEADCALTIAKTMIMPPCIEYQRQVAVAINAIVQAAQHSDLSTHRDLLARLTTLINNMSAAIRKLESPEQRGSPSDRLAALHQLRSAVDGLEEHVPHDKWPLPTYADLLFIL